MKILGLGGSFHDLSCCLLENGEIKVAIEQERLSREKHALGRKSQKYTQIKYCLDQTPIKDIDLIIGNDLIIFNDLIDKELLNHAVRINHHMAHAASSYYTSGFDNAAVLVIDGAGSGYNTLKGEMSETCSFGEAQQGAIDLNKRFYGQYVTNINFRRIKHKENIVENDYYHFHVNSLGDFYAFMSEFCGFEKQQEGKLMGLAPYGTDRYLKELKRFVNIDLPNAINVNIISGEFFYVVDEILRTEVGKRNLFDIQADFAYVTQAIFEENVFQVMNYLYDKTHNKNLCYAGGAALNSVLNGKIKQKTPFENVYIFPAANDGGTSIGAAYYGYYNIFKNKYTPKRLEHCYFGKTYNSLSIEKAINNNDNITYRKLDVDLVYEEISDRLSNGEIIGWFQDGSEFGPRSLGNRSILADPRKTDMKDILNKKVKFRENFRPFAPVILKEHVTEYFGTDFPDNPFMLYVGEVKHNKINSIPAVTHVDNSARLQTISYETNEKLYRLISSFMRITNVPILLNTSFNIKGEPIVETPQDAMKAFLGSEMDVLVIDNYIIDKR